MKVSFSTLGCPDWTLAQILSLAAKTRYDGVELRFVEGEADLWKLPAFSGTALPVTRRAIQDNGLVISCVDTSCYFHWVDAEKRRYSVEQGEKMADLAAALGAPGIRVFGDKVQPGTDRAATSQRIGEGIWALAEKVRPKGVEVWLETHGDFASSRDTAKILTSVGAHGIGAVWDPANCFIEMGETPAEGGPRLGAAIRHVHMKDLQRSASGKGWDLVLTGSGTFPLLQIFAALRHFAYRGFVSFEWEKKWHPELPDASIALPHFMEWYRSRQPA